MAQKVSISCFLFLKKFSRLVSNNDVIENFTFEDKARPIVSKRSIIGIPEYCVKEVIRKGEFLLKLLIIIIYLLEDFSCVYTASKHDDLEIVNIKVLSKNNTIELEKVESIKNEIQTLRSAGHPFVVRKSFIQKGS